MCFIMLFAGGSFYVWNYCEAENTTPLLYLLSFQTIRELVKLAIEFEPSR